MNHPRRRLALILPLVLAPSASADESALTLADLEAYRVALGAKPEGPAPPATFRDLWDRPGAHLGRRITVGGRVARLFRQPPVGDFPALAEAWIVSEAGDPTCLVFPQASARSGPEVGASVRFAGTFLRKIRYDGGDQPRLAPLVVGPAPPSTAPADLGGPSWSTVDWIMGLGAASAVATALMRRHLARPPSPIATPGPPPEFLDGGTDLEPEGADHDDR